MTDFIKTNKIIPINKLKVHKTLGTEYLPHEVFSSVSHGFGEF